MMANSHVFDALLQACGGKLRPSGKVGFRCPVQQHGGPTTAWAMEAEDGRVIAKCSACGAGTNRILEAFNISVSDNRGGKTSVAVKSGVREASKSKAELGNFNEEMAGFVEAYRSLDAWLEVCLAAKINFRSKRAGKGESLSDVKAKAESEFNRDKASELYTTMREVVADHHGAYDGAWDDKKNMLDGSYYPEKLDGLVGAFPANAVAHSFKLPQLPKGVLWGMIHPHKTDDEINPYKSGQTMHWELTPENVSTKKLNIAGWSIPPAAIYKPAEIAIPKCLFICEGEGDATSIAVAGGIGVSTGSITRISATISKCAAMLADKPDWRCYLIDDMDAGGTGGQRNKEVKGWIDAATEFLPGQWHREEHGILGRPPDKERGEPRDTDARWLAYTYGYQALQNRLKEIAGL